ncbi:uncharacterized aarF domain-containing protein kinase 1 [Neltuma alba]|uniref:uncharacterized aarF domain-containing protein kinase 1 n=1 Tax=Neltuma alba TaxID=207710 RepID=UPI0010A5937B|nr:uncharacterized aarF domain-containing protein kinase 1 [Prosopis alba]
MKAKSFKFPAKARSAAFLAAVAAISLPATNYVLNLPSSDSFPDKISTVIHGILRSSRAITTVACTVADYKYSLRGLQKDSNEYRHEMSEVHLRSAKRILKLCEANKGFYVKAGQFVAAQGVIPKEYSSTLSALQDQVSPCSFKAIKEVLVHNLGPNLSEMFSSVNEQPIAAASISQVHHAVLKSGHEVAIKVQYPDLEQQMNFDTRTMSFLSKTIAQFFPEYRFEWLASAFTKAIALELDFVQEARNSERAASSFKNNKFFRVPHVYWELTTRQVLTMQFCTGHKIDDLDFLKQAGLDPEKVASALVEIFAEMIFVHGYIHGDPHPGNILVSPDGCNGFSLVLLDHGIYWELDEKFRKDFCQLWEALLLQDSKKIMCLGERFGIGKYSKYLPIIFTGRNIESKSGLGSGMSTEEKENMKKELKSLLFEDLSPFMESLPPEFLSIMRVDGLLRSIIRKLGASRWIRWLAYAKYGMYGIYQKLDAESDFAAKAVFFRLISELKYYEILIKLIVGEIEAKFVVPLLQKMKSALNYMARSMVPFGAS